MIDRLIDIHKRLNKLSILAVVVEVSKNNTATRCQEIGQQRVVRKLGRAAQTRDTGITQDGKLGGSQIKVVDRAASTACRKQVASSSEGQGRSATGQIVQTQTRTSANVLQAVA